MIDTELERERARADALVAALPKCAWFDANTKGERWSECPEISTLQTDIDNGDSVGVTRFYCPTHLPDYGTDTGPTPWAEVVAQHRAARLDAKTTHPKEDDRQFMLATGMDEACLDGSCGHPMCALEIALFAQREDAEREMEAELLWLFERSSFTSPTLTKRLREALSQQTEGPAHLGPLAVRESGDVVILTNSERWVIREVLSCASGGTMATSDDVTSYLLRKCAKNSVSGLRARWLIDTFELPLNDDHGKEIASWDHLGADPDEPPPAKQLLRQDAERIVLRRMVRALASLVKSAGQVGP